MDEVNRSMDALQAKHLQTERSLQAAVSPSVRQRLQQQFEQELELMDAQRKVYEDLEFQQLEVCFYFYFFLLDMNIFLHKG